jgi:hypothetical protein
VWSVQSMYDEQSAVSRKNRRFVWDSFWPAGCGPRSRRLSAVEGRHKAACMGTNLIDLESLRS